jgi:hypothetical protein
MAGISSSHGAHHVAQKFSSTTWPRSEARLTSPSPERRGSVKSGAALPREIGAGARELP